MKQKLYLAGGFKSDWQSNVKESLGYKFEIYNPREIEFGIYNKEKRFNLPLDQYGVWDLHHIKRSDIVLLYVEKTNPGIALYVEAGYAKGLGKTVVSVIEPENEHIEDRYVDFVRLVSDITFDNVKDGIQYLKKFC